MGQLGTWGAPPCALQLHRCWLLRHRLWAYWHWLRAGEVGAPQPQVQSYKRKRTARTVLALYEQSPKFGKSMGWQMNRWDLRSSYSRSTAPLALEADVWLWGLGDCTGCWGLPASCGLQLRCRKVPGKLHFAAAQWQINWCHQPLLCWPQSQSTG